ncbi:hypothetical protein SAMN05421545_1721 [Pontibacter lucknowensis]|uniref:Uncharacterized protein n=1 Tax=Pontibacter lucknowensis TaxID=1077936 RepID=A0A1N6WRY5_9BACT|nr:hypothetical protein SAMN05421545_1721 [Pontibacter lucknowensis]
MNILYGQPYQSRRQIYLLFTLLALLLFALPAQAQDCNCTDAFEQTVQNYEKNYSLFRLKVTDKNQEIYKAHTFEFVNFNNWAKARTQRRFN